MISGSVAASAATLTKPVGNLTPVGGDYLVLQDITVQPTQVWYEGFNSVNISNVVNWVQAPIAPAFEPVVAMMW